VLSAISRGGVEVSAAVEPPICVFAARGPGGCASQDRGPSGDRAVARGLVSRSCSVGSAFLNVIAS
jgi:hypothetical protein